MVMGEYSAYSSLQADSNVKFAAWPIRGHLALTDFRPDDPKWTIAYDWRRTVDDNTINVVLGISISIIITPGFERYVSDHPYK